MIITGIPNDDLIYQDESYRLSKDKVQVILNALNTDITADSYKLYTFPSAEGR